MAKENKEGSQGNNNQNQGGSSKPKESVQERFNKGAGATRGSRSEDRPTDPKKKS